MPIIISDTSPLRALQHLNRLDVLNLFYGEVLVPPAVAAELRNPDSTLPPLEVAAVPWIRVQSPRDQAAVRRFLVELDPGESEAITLALELRAEAILIDEAEGRAVARRQGLRTIGVLSVLVRAKAEGIISAVRPLIDRLQNELDFRVSDSLRATILRRAGETGP